MDKFMINVPYWLRGGKKRWFRWDEELLITGIVICMTIHSTFSLENQFIIEQNIINKSITIFIKYGVRLY